MKTPSRANRRWTRAEYERLIAHGFFQPGERAELIGGEILTTVTPQGSRHATAITMVMAALQTAFGPGYMVRSQLPVALDDESEPEPDISVVKGKPLDYLKWHPRDAVLVVEVADTSTTFDRARKGSLYARAGLQDYWIANLKRQVLEVYREPAPSPRARYGWAYRVVRRLGLDASVSPLGKPDAVIPVAALIPPVEG